ncbi:MAG: hypothetical protein QOH06_345 [Acidobacteriota bacterium]|jgi:hypothetical protein|nr:hypothetical protein [Acidobacteriota bacterium]
MQTAFKDYWDLALASVDRQLVAAASACADNGISIHVAPVDIPTIREALERVRPIAFPRDMHAYPESGHKILLSESFFQETLKWLQEEIRQLLNTLPADRYEVELKEVLHVLALSAEDTALHFGTLTEGWDRLVLIKHRLLLPNDAVLARSAWLVSLMADFERSLRDAICLPIQCLGRLDPIMQAAASTIAEQGIKLRADAVLRHERTADAAAQAISESMAEGVAPALVVAHCFGERLGILDVKSQSFERGFYIALKDLGSDSDEIILRLVDLRRIALHDTSSVAARPSAGSRARIKASLGELGKWNSEKLKEVAQFLYSYSIRYTLDVMDVVSRLVRDGSRKEALSPVARYKAASELRVGTLVLLKQRLWWLAWSLADHVRARYEHRDDGLMLRLNAVFAQSQIKMLREWRKEARAIEVTDRAPRYRLLKRCILGEWSGISPLIRESVTSGDMTLEELSSWPALEPLRARAEYNKVIKELEER